MNDPDLKYAIILQKQLNKELDLNDADDSLLALQLQEEFNHEYKTETGMGLSYNNKKTNKDNGKSLVDPSWELVDPTPNIHNLFVVFNERFFWNKLLTVCVSWSKRMTSCAGICSYQGRGGMCSITLSEPLLKLRPRKDLVETLLHEMIHAYLFVTHNNRDRDGHGPEFHKHMYRINGEAGTNITVYHSFHDEVRLYQQHWWRCDGPCQNRKPFFGMVRRSINRAPGPNDRWWSEHQRNCGGKFIKVREPEKKKPLQPSKKANVSESNGDIRKFVTSPLKNKPTIISVTSPTHLMKTSPTKSPKKTFSPNHDIRKYFTKNSTTNVDKNSIQTVDNKNGKSPEVTPVFNSGNIHGFKNLGTNVSKVRKNLSDTKYNKSNGFIGVKSNNSNTVVVTSKNSSTSSNTLKSDENEMVPQLFPGTGRVLSASQNTIDYNKVRDHWLKKYDNVNTNNQNKRQASDELDQKRNNKLHKSHSVQEKEELHFITCPICDEIIPYLEADRHIDECLNKQYNVQELDTKETCCNCNKQIPKSTYNEHLSTCLNDSIASDDLEELEQCPICETLVNKSTIYEHTTECIEKNTTPNENQNKPNDFTQCSICSEFVESNKYPVHLEKCLHKVLDNIEEQYDLPSTNTKVNCLVCAKEILKSDLNAHLDECMSGVFDKKFSDAEEPINDNNENDKAKPSCSKDCDATMKYNCPICMDMYSELDMSGHLEQCLQTDAEDGSDKAVLIQSFSSDDFQL